MRFRKSSIPATPISASPPGPGSGVPTGALHVPGAKTDAVLGHGTFPQKAMPKATSTWPVIFPRGERGKQSTLHLAGFGETEAPCSCRSRGKDRKVSQIVQTPFLWLVSHLLGA